MAFLLDTHTLLWFLEGNDSLPKKASKKISAPENQCYISIASLWEIAIKIKLGKLTIKFPFERFADYLADNDIELLQLSFNHLIKLMDLDYHHRDPFDRIIVAQALVEDLTIITKDEHFSLYTDNIYWK